MTSKVFVSGSMRIKHLDKSVLDRLERILGKEYAVIVGDADGVDKSIQSFLKSRGARSVVVYCTGASPRNNLGDWSTECVESLSEPGTRAYFTAKDIKMAEDCDYGLMVWDTKSTGTLRNAMELLSRRKSSLIYVNKQKFFHKVKEIEDFEKLLSFMSDSARRKAEQKLKLSQTLASLKYDQRQLFSA